MAPCIHCATKPKGYDGPCIGYCPGVVVVVDAADNVVVVAIVVAVFVLVAIAVVAAAAVGNSDVLIPGSIRGVIEPRKHHA